MGLAALANTHQEQMHARPPLYAPLPDALERTRGTARSWQTVPVPCMDTTAHASAQTAAFIAPAMPNNLDNATSQPFLGPPVHRTRKLRE